MVCQIYKTGDVETMAITALLLPICLHYTYIECLIQKQKQNNEGFDIEL